MGNKLDQFDLSKFMGAVKDFARGYTFYVTIPYLSDDNVYLVKSSSLPVGTINPIETDWQGNKYKLAGTQEYTDFTVTFNVDTKDKIRQEFVGWQKFVHDTETNMHGDPDKYMNNITVTHISHMTNESIMEYELVRAWPTSVGELALDYSSQDVATFDVTFAYQYHIVTPIVNKK